MRFLGPLLSLLAASPLALAAASTEDDKLQKISKLVSKSNNGLIQLTNALYTEITTAPRNYTAAILLTALDKKFGCALCAEFHPEYELLSKSWNKQHKNGDGLYFGVLDFERGRDTFMKLGLNTAPLLFLFPPTVGPNADPLHATDPHKFDFSPNQIPAELVARWIAQTVAHEPKVVRPYDYTNIVTGLVSVIAGAVLLKFTFPIIKPALYSRNLWAAISLIAILLFTSGHMFNHIRRVPYVANNGKGGVSYIAGGFSNQFGLETQIIAVIYAVLSFCVISLGMKMPREADPSTQKIKILVWNALLLVTFSYLLSIFRQKNGGYPFFLPPMM